MDNDNIILFLMAFMLLVGVDVVEGQPRPINVHEPATWERPVLIAHRGGVVTPTSPENSAIAVQLAAEHGFDMVEVDVRESKDHVPIAFHDNNMLDAAGTNARVEDLTAKQIRGLRYQGTKQKILMLDQYLKLCAQFGLGVMLDIKTDEGGKQFFQAIAALLEKHRLSRSAITISHHPLAVRYLEAQVMFALTEREEKKVRRGDSLSFSGKFWFGLPRNINIDAIKKMQNSGVMVIPAINIFRYDENDHMSEAKREIVRMKKAGVDAYQIDSVYERFFR